MDTYNLEVHDGLCSSRLHQYEMGLWMNLTSATPVRQLRRQVSGCARYQLAKSAVLLLIALTLSLGFALPAQAQSDETPSISVHTPRSTVSIEEEIELSFRASSPVPGSVKVRIEITIRGPFIDESVVIERGPYQSESAGEVIGWNVVPSAVREDYDYSGATFTATILPGAGYTVGSPSSVSVFVRGNEGQDSDQQSDDGSSAPGVAPRRIPLSAAQPHPPLPFCPATAWSYNATTCRTIVPMPPSTSVSAGSLWTAPRQSSSAWFATPT